MYGLLKYYHAYILLISKGLDGTTTRSLECVLIPSSISVALKGRQISAKTTCNFIIYSGLLCYNKAHCAWNNKYSGQEEATLRIVKFLKESRELVLQMRD